MNDSFDLGGTGGKSFSFGAPGSQPGAWVAGHVLEIKEVQKTTYSPNGGSGAPEFWDNGDPKMQYRVTLATDQRDPGDQADDGKRNVYLDGRRTAHDNGTKSKICAVLDAVRAVTGGTQIPRGSWLALKWVSGMGVTGDPRCFEAQFQPATVDLGVSTAGPPAAPLAAPPFHQQQAQAYAGQQGPPPGWAQPAQQPVAAPAAQAPGVPTPEQIAAVRAGGMDPAVVWPGITLPA